MSPTPFDPPGEVRRWTTLALKGHRDVRACWFYTRTDPYAVHLSIHTRAGSNPVEWVFSRELLHEGLQCRAGRGDVTVQPHGQHFLQVDLSSPSGHATLHGVWADVDEFLSDTADVVPFGCEAGVLDVDSALLELMDRDGGWSAAA